MAVGRCSVEYLRLIQASLAQVMGTFSCKTFMAAYYMHFHEGQRYWQPLGRRTTAIFQVLPSAADLANYRQKCTSTTGTQTGSPQMTCASSTKSGDSLHHRAQTHRKVSNVYYHCRPECVWLQCPDFVPPQLGIYTLNSYFVITLAVYACAHTGVYTIHA